MPTIHRAQGFDFMIHPNDHEPAHVHVYHADGVVIVLLGDANTLPSVRAIRGPVKDRDVVRAVRTVEENQETMLAEWRRIHG